MKIYHKPSLYFAFLYFGIALLFVYNTLYKEDGQLFQAAGCFFAGLYQLYCALSRKRARELTIRDSDEMLILENLKCYRAAYRTTIVLLLLISLMFSRSTDTVFLCLSLTAFLTCFLMIAVHALILIMAASHNAQ